MAGCYRRCRKPIIPRKGLQTQLIPIIEGVPVNRSSFGEIRAWFVCQNGPDDLEEAGKIFHQETAGPPL